MTFEQCQKSYLNVGRNRRAEEDADKSPDGRPVLGRKGIGKFAGFGIAEVLEVDTISGTTGEQTKFRLDLGSLRGTDYIGTEPQEVPILIQEPANNARIKDRGTVITLKSLKLSRRPNPQNFSRSMARRFLIAQKADDFIVKIDGEPLPEDNELVGVEFDFPKDYRDAEKPEDLVIDNDWGVEPIGDDELRWRIKFTKDTINTEELRGVSVFCGIKVAQTPFSSISPAASPDSTASSTCPAK